MTMTRRCGSVSFELGSPGRDFYNVTELDDRSTPAVMESPARTGTQSVERALRIVREVATRFHLGARLSDIAERCQLDPGTTRRLLACLVRERMLEQRASDRRYLPGPLLFEFGLTLPAYAAFQEACREPLSRLARRFKGAAFLYVRSGSEVVCMGREDAVVIPGVWSRVGTRKPLVGTAGALAILIELPRKEADEIAEQYLATIAGVNDKRARAIRKIVRQSRTLGYGINEGELVHGLSSFAVAIHDAADAPFASVSFVGARGPYEATQREAIIDGLRKEAYVIKGIAGNVFAPSPPASELA